MKSSGLWFCFLIMIPFMIKNCMASVLKKGRLDLGFQGTQMNWIDNDGLILLSNNSNFAFGFSSTQDVPLFQLVVVHKSSTKVVWSANRGSLVSNSDNFVFDNTGNAFLQSGGSVIWSTDTAGKGVAAMELSDSGNLVLVGNDSKIIWQSFSYPTDTLLSNHEFSEGMKLVSNPNSNNLSYTLEITSGDMILSASFQKPQPYWAISKDSRNIINQNGGNVTKATLVTNSWNFYDKDDILLWYFVFSPNTDANATWIAVLGNDGFITFTVLQNGGSSAASQILIPQDECSRPAACDPYYICYSGNKCQCPSALPSCKPGNDSQLCEPGSELVDAGDNLSYFALEYVTPTAKTTLYNCKNLCMANCSCKAMFFNSSSGSCYAFNQIGNLQGSIGNGPTYSSYIKISRNGSKQSSNNGKNNDSKCVAIVVSVVCATLFVNIALLVAGYFYLKKKFKNTSEPNKASSEEDDFLEGSPRSSSKLELSFKRLNPISKGPSPSRP